MILRIGSRNQRNKYLTGFTLIELVLVILLISILVALSTPLFRRTFSDLELRNTAFNITKLINYAQEMAIIERTNYKLNFDFKKGKYHLTYLVATEDTPVYEKIEGRHGKTFLVPRGLTLEGKKDEIIFYPDGRSDKVKLNLIDKNGKGYLLRVKGFGRHVEMEEITG
ncbi:MAG: prepilin-type N-terminal cleavage/methylation domain-containing protein [Candidatus Omnitrophica bacterium]|nr:prepilin-type N-terminal cleavage/methylation domain-containing protein [Candidatus Omnitrophota bacterium]